MPDEAPPAPPPFDEHLFEWRRDRDARVRQPQPRHNLYPSGDDARMRLDGSVVFYEGSPVNTRIRDGFRAELSDLITGDLHEVDVNDGTLDIGARPLGFVNCGKSAHYLRRYPYRRHKQGLHPNNTMPTNIATGRLGLWDFSYCNLGHALLGQYPTIEEAKRVLHDVPNKEAVSFTRKLALRKTSVPDIHILYLTDEPIAYCFKDTFRFGSEEKYEAYQDLVKEHGDVTQ